MDDIVGRLAAGIFLIIALILIPIVWVFSNLDLSQHSAVNNIVNSYTEEIRTTGVISKANYEDFIRRLQQTGMTFDISVLHKSKAAVPGDSANSYTIAYRSYNKNDILGVIEGYGADGEPNTSDDETPRDYIMKSGDQISITVQSIEETSGSKYIRLLTNGSSAIRLKASAGGMVGNTR